MIGYFVIAPVIQVFLLTGFTNGQNYEDMVDVVIYYDALSPFARRFMIKQLSPFLKGDLSPYINLTLIPYGKAVTVGWNGAGFGCTFCNSDAECYANKLQVCALDLLNHGLNTPGLGFNKEAVEFAVCLMEDLNTISSIDEIDTAFKKCKVTAEYDDIKSCANGKLVKKALGRMGTLTNNFQNPLENSLIIFFNGVFRKKEGDEAEMNFKKTFCSKIIYRHHKACQEGAVSSATTQIPYQEKVDVVIYYDALSPFARRFMIKQLSPFLKGDLLPYINLTLVPYGRAVTYQRNDSYYEFNCYHGEAECYGNKIQVCALVLLNYGLNTQGLGFNKEAVEFIVCLMEDLNVTSSINAIETAFEKCKVSAEYDSIKSCADGTLGSKALAYTGYLTNHFQNPLENVPTIVFNGVFRKRVSDQSERNFKEQFFSQIKWTNLPAYEEEDGFATSTTYIP